MGLAFIGASLSNIGLAFSRDSHLLIAVLVAYALIAVMGFVSFWSLRTLSVPRLIFAVGVYLLIAEQAVDAGGIYGFGAFYFLLAFPIVYMSFGLRFSVVSMILYCAAFSSRLYLGVPFPESIYNILAVRDRSIVLLGFAAAVEIAICFCFDRIFKHLSAQAFSDQVSGLPNRLKVEDSIRRDIAYYRGFSHEFSVLAIKMLNLNRVNTLLGTEGCDAVLRETGTRLQSFALETRIVGRWSSSIFVLVCELHDPQEVERFALSVLEALTAPQCANGRTITVNFSIAVSRYPEDSNTGNSIVDNAISLLDSASAQTGDIRFFSADTLRAKQYRYSILDNLSKANFDRSFRLVYQPKVRITDRVCIGAEALIRWHDEQFGDVSPGVFIPMAEQTGFIRKITRWVIRRCVADAIAVRGACGPIARDLTFSVNISVADLRDKGFIDFLSREVLSIPDMVNSIQFEITEGSMLDEDAQVKQNLGHLQAVGFRIAIDDFGTGYSSLSYLHKIRVNELKIDQSFIRNLFAIDTPDETPVIDAIISMSKALGFAITAEGVESEEQLSWLEDNGCDTVQGFLFSRGIPVDDFIAFVRGAHAATRSRSRAQAELADESRILS